MFRKNLWSERWHPEEQASRIRKTNAHMVPQAPGSTIQSHGTSVPDPEP
jgi:hypothetical protein